MELLNRQVIHKSPMLGKGVIVEVKTGQNGQLHLVIQFSARKMELQYPQAFGDFVRAADHDFQQQALADLRAMKQADEEKKEAERRLREEKKLEVEKTREKMKLPKTSFSVIRDGKPVVFYVFHDSSRGDLFAKKVEEGYFWVPKENVHGASIYYWDLIQEIKKGDLILHGYKGQVYAYSYAQGECYDCIEPENTCRNSLERRMGRRIDCRYRVIPKPIVTNDYVDEIKRYSRQHYSAFDKDGNGQGVIAVLEKEIADLFIRETERLNPELEFTETTDGV